VSLRRLTVIQLPQHSWGGFEHADVDSESGQVFLAHPANGTVEVIDGERLEWKATLLGHPDSTGVICAQEVGMVFVANGGAGKVSMIDRASHDLVRDIAVGPRPAGLAWDPSVRSLLNVDLEDHRARVIDVDTGTVVASSRLPGRPRWPVWDRTMRRFLVNVREPACVALIDPATASLTGLWPLTEAGPHGLDVDPVTRQALVACDSGVTLALDVANGRELGRVETGAQPDVIWFNPERRFLYVAIGDPGLLDVIDTASMSVVEQVTTGLGAHTTAFDRRRQLIYVFEPEAAVAEVFEQN
jgi:DNA-binding beta-propeller fold protein YncE